MVNKKNAKKVYKFLTAHPKVHAQSDWVSLDGSMPDADKERMAEIEANVERNWCGTTMCAAGAAVWVVNGKKDFRKTIKAFWDGESDDHVWTNKGAEILGLSQYQADSLFYNMDDKSALAMLKALSKGDEAEFDRLTREEADI